MKLTAHQFMEKLNSNGLRIALVGMSNSGKSTSSRVLANAGFETYEVDERINATLGLGSMEAAAEWMGYPFEEKYVAQRARYLELEEQFTQIEIPTAKNFVLDTTGSIIHTSDTTRNWLTQNFLIVGLAISDQLSRQLIDDYFSNPKTVVWGDEFQIQQDEKPTDALKRCYPQLLANRIQKYQALADVEVPADLARSPSLTPEKLLDEIRGQL